MKNRKNHNRPERDQEPGSIEKGREALKKLGILLLNFILFYALLRIIIALSESTGQLWIYYAGTLLYGIAGGAALLGLLLYQHYGDERRKVLQYSTICSNAGVLGNALAEGIFGEMGLLYASIFVVPMRTFMWSLGLTYFTEAPDKKTLVKKVLTHPCIVAVIIGFVIMGFQIQLPGFLDQTVKTVANVNTYLAMLLVGTILASVNPKTLIDKDVLYYAFVRLGLMPFLVFAACKLAGMDSLVTGVSVVLTGMPAASSTAAVASKYHKDEVFATKCVVFTTLLSMITVPIWCMLL